MKREGIEARAITIDYVNHRGERANRRIVPEYLWWGTTEWHPREGWLLHAIDLDKELYRDFAWEGIVGPGDGAHEALLMTTPIDDSPVEQRERALGRMQSYADYRETLLQFHEWLHARYPDAAVEMCRCGVLDGRKPVPPLSDLLPPGGS